MVAVGADVSESGGASQRASGTPASGPPPPSSPPWLLPPHASSSVATPIDPRTPPSYEPCAGGGETFGFGFALLRFGASSSREPRPIHPLWRNQIRIPAATSAITASANG